MVVMVAVFSSDGVLMVVMAAGVRVSRAPSPALCPVYKSVSCGQTAAP